MSSSVIRDIMERDPLAKFLTEKSLLTVAQLDTVLIHRLALARGVTMREMVSMRDGGPVSKGSFLRTLRQCEQNLRGCVYTLILAIYLGLVEAPTSSALVRVSNTVSAVKGITLSPEDRSTLLSSLEELAKSVIQRSSGQNL